MFGFFPLVETTATLDLGIYLGIQMRLRIINFPVTDAPLCHQVVAVVSLVRHTCRVQ